MAIRQYDMTPLQEVAVGLDMRGVQGQASPWAGPMQRIDEILQENKDKPFVQRILNPGDLRLDRGDGKFSTHSMAWGEADGTFYVYPTVMQDENGQLKDYGDQAWQHAKDTGNVIPFDNAKEAAWFSENYKKVWEMQGGQKPAPHKQTWLETADAILRHDNEIWSMLGAWQEHRDRQGARNLTPGQANYDPFDGLPDEYAPFADQFRGVQSKAERDIVIRSLNTERNRIQTIANAGAEKYAWGMIAALGSPSFWGFILANPTAGVENAMGGAIRAATIGTAQVAVSEAILSSTQHIRPWQESFANIGTAGLFSAAFGGVVGRSLSRSQTTGAIRDIMRDVEAIASEDGVDVVQLLRDTPDSVGAAQVVGSLEAEAPIHPPLLKNNAGSYITIFHRIAGAKIPEAFAVMNEYFAHALSIGKNRIAWKAITNEQGQIIGNDVRVGRKTVGLKAEDGWTVAWIPKQKALNTMVNREESAFMRRGKILMTEGYKAWAGVRYIGQGYLRGAEKRFSEFDKLVSRALSGEQTTDPVVRRTADAIRQDILNPIRDKAIELGAFPEGIKAKYADQWWHRRYNRIGIHKNRILWEDVLTRHFKTAREEGAFKSAVETATTKVKEADTAFQARRKELLAEQQALKDEISKLVKAKQALKTPKAIARKDAEIKRARAKLERRKIKFKGEPKKAKLLADLKAAKKELRGIRREQFDINDPEILDEIKNDVLLSTERIMYGTQGGPMYGRPTGGNALKERALPVPDDVLREHGFLIENVEEILHGHIRGTWRPLRMMEKAGDAEMEGVFENLRTAYRNRIGPLLEKGTPEAAKAAQVLEKDMNEVVSMLELARDRYYHRTAGAAENPTLAALGSMSRILRAYEMTTKLGGVVFSSLGDAARVAISGAGRMMLAPLNPQLIKDFRIALNSFTREELQEIGVAAETATRARTMMLAELNDMGAMTTKAEEVVRRITGGFMTATGLTQWTDFMKMWAAVSAQRSMLREMRKYATLSSVRKQLMAERGYGESEVQRILAQVDEFGEETGNKLLMNWDDWTDREMAELVKTDIFQESERVLVTPTEIDRPVFADKEWARLLLQFKSFALAAHNQVTQRLISNMRSGDAQSAAVLLNTILIGMGVDMVKMYAAGRGDELDKYTLGDYVLGGIDRGGALPIFMEAFNQMDLVSHNALTGAFGAMPTQRFSDRSPISVLGPAASTLGDLYDLAGFWARPHPRDYEAGKDGHSKWKDRFVNDKLLNERDIRLIRRMVPYNNLAWTRWFVDYMQNQASEGLEKVPARSRKRNRDGTYK